MSGDGRQHHRRARVEAIRSWAKNGVLARRPELPIEKAFKERLGQHGNSFFSPLPLPYSDDQHYNIQLSYLVDAMDALPLRPDLAFDSAWKAFEAVTKNGISTTGHSVGAISGNITRRMRWAVLLGHLDGPVAEILLTSVPAQSCEYLYKRVISRSHDQVLLRLITPPSEIPDGLHSFLSLTESKYGQPDNHGDARRGAMFLRRALNGDILNIQGLDIQLSQRARLHLLVSGILYSARND